MSAISDAFDKAPSNRPGVQKTPELGRILALPRRKLDLDEGTVDGKPILDLNDLYLINGGRCAEYPKCPVCASGSAALWPTQSAALLEAERAWGLFGPLGVGSGKTLVTLLLPDVFGSTRTVLLVPAALKNQLLTRDFADYGRHFKLPLDRITVVAYSELSIVSGADVLDRVKPDLIIADECHAISRANSARSKRWVRYMQANPGTRFCGLSGTVTRRSLRDYAHLCEAALRAGSPVPGRWSDLQEWSDALDPIKDPLPIGALRVLADPTDIRLEMGPDEARAAVREGYRRRLTETYGVVATSESWEGASLVVAALRPQVPSLIEKSISMLMKTWEIGGEEIAEAMRLKEIARQLAVGFFYKWMWPDGIVDEEWLFARAAWNKFVRQILQRSKAGLDSPLLVARAAASGKLESVEWPAWSAVKDRPEPPVEAVWLSDFVVKETIAWAERQLAHDGEPAIIWYSHNALGEVFAERTGFHVYGAGQDAGEADPEREKVIFCSIRSQGTGKNLQRYAKSLVIEPPSSGATWEQLCGRMHRPGQQADEVWFDVFAHTLELEQAMLTAVEDARYTQQTHGQRQKLLVARRVGW